MISPLQLLGYLRREEIPPLNRIPGKLLDFLVAFSSARSRFTTISSLERVLAAFRHKALDRVPVTPFLCSGSRNINGIPFPDFALKGEKAAEAFLSGFEFVGGDLIVLMLDLSVEAADFGQKMLYPENSTPLPDYLNPVINDVSGYTALKRLDFAKAARMNEFVKLCRIMVKKIGFRSVVTGFVFGPLGVLGMMRGAEKLFKDCMLYPDRVIKACETITGTLIEFVEAQADAGVPAIAIDTLFASGNGLSKPLWEKIEGPFVSQISKAIKKRGLYTAVHNCGNNLYFDSQIRFMEPEAISFAHLPDDCATPQELKNKYGDKTVLVGYLPTPLLINGTPRAVMNACRRQIDDLGRDGGFILAPGCEYPPNIPMDNAFAIIQAASEYKLTAALR